MTITQHVIGQESADHHMPGIGEDRSELCHRRAFVFEIGRWMLCFSATNFFDGESNPLATNQPTNQRNSTLNLSS